MGKIMPSISPDMIDIKPPSFHPYVFIETTSKMPSSIAMTAAAGGAMKYIDLPMTFTANDLPQVQPIVREHFQEHEGHCALFGKVVRYRFMYSPTESILLDTEGNETGRQQGRYWPQSISIQE
jgi:hypothetical protein